MKIEQINQSFLESIKKDKRVINRLAVKGKMYDKVVRVNKPEASPTNSVVSSMTSVSSSTNSVASSYVQRKQARSATQKAENTLKELKAFTNMLVVT